MCYWTMIKRSEADSKMAEGSMKAGKSAEKTVASGTTTAAAGGTSAGKSYSTFMKRIEKDERKQEEPVS